MLWLHLSHRVETLRERLLAQLAGPREDPLVAETVIVGSAAMQRWLTLAIADAHGICTRVDFPFLAQWLWLQLRQRPGAATPGLALTPAALSWRVWRLLGDETFVAAQPRLARYLEGGDALQAFELAERAALALDQVLAYRPRWIERWGRGELAALAHDAAGDQAWQAALWQRIAEALQLGSGHPLHALQAWPGTGSGSAGSARGLEGEAPPLHLFALPALAPFQVQLLGEIAARRAVHVYALNPCREYWFDLVPPKRWSRLARSGQAESHDIGHPLLAAWGRQTQALIDTLFERVGDERLALAVDEADADDADSADDAPDADDADDAANLAQAADRAATADTAPPANPTEPALRQPSLLAQLQHGLLHLQPPAPGRLRLAAGDRSLELHHCHSLTRELEVLHDRLLGLMREAEAAGAPLRPGEILVATPSLDEAAPLIEAVFGTQPPARRIPFTITGLPERRRSAPARVLLALVALLGSRASASDLFALLQEPLVARRFGLDDEALVRVHGWLREAGLHWGLSAAHRRALGLAEDDRHTLADAVERLLLGHLLPDPADAVEAPAEAPGSHALDTADAPFQGKLPAGGAEGSKAQALGALARFAEGLRRLEQRSRDAQSAAEWQALLLAALDVFVDAAADDADDLLALRRQLGELAQAQALGGLTDHDPIPLAVMQRALATRLEEPARGGVPSGGVTFAAMASLRHLPYRVVAVIGLNGHGASAYPGAGGAGGLGDFDLIAAHPQRGDHQRRLDERNVFLDLLMATRSHLHLSCTARSVRDNAALPPSVLLDELLEFTVAGLAPAGADAAERARWQARLVVEHPLQAFSPSAFLQGSDLRLRSHDAELAQALQAAARAAAESAAGLAAESVAGSAGFDADPATMGAPDGDADGDDEAADADDSDDGTPADDDSARLDPPFFTQPLPPLEPPADGGPHTVKLAELVAFLNNPARRLLRQRLRITLPREDDTLDDDEPFVLDRQAEQRLAERLLPRLIHGSTPPDAEALLALALAGPEPPAGVIGAHQLEGLLQELQAFAGRVRTVVAARAAQPLPPQALHLACTLEGQPWVLEDRLADTPSQPFVRWRFDTLRSRDRLEAWVWHLALQHAGLPAPLCWIARDATLSFEPVADAGLRLQELLVLMAQGQQQPLPFHLRSAEALVREGLSRAQQLWRGNDFSRGERLDPARALAWRGQPEPLGAAFRAHAETVFRPLIAHERLTPVWQGV